MSEHETPSPYPHWMLREIHEQPESLTATLDRYVGSEGFRAEVCQPVRSWLRAANQEIVIAASGSSRHAGMIAEILIEDICGIPVDVEYASEYCYRPEQATKNAALMVISQSGETADTLAALRKANASGHPTLAITNVLNSTMAREAGASFCTLAGRERAIPATKSFTAQLLNLQLLSLLAAESQQSISAAELKSRLAELGSLPDLVRSQLNSWQDSARTAAEKLKQAESFLYLGRGVHYPVAREGALKLKESAYLHAEGYPSGELKHGPNALVSERTPLVMVATQDTSDPDSVERYGKVLQLMRDMHVQGATILALANAGDQEVASVASHVIPIAEASEALLAISEVIPLQMLSYFMAVNRGIDVDHPRNLTKAVLAE